MATLASIFALVTEQKVKIVVIYGNFQDHWYPRPGIINKHCMYVNGVW